MTTYIVEKKTDFKEADNGQLNLLLPLKKKLTSTLRKKAVMKSNSRKNDNKF